MIAATGGVVKRCNVDEEREWGTDEHELDIRFL
jgi:hypothetical protein